MKLKMYSLCYLPFTILSLLSIIRVALGYTEMLPQMMKTLCDSTESNPEKTTAIGECTSKMFDDPTMASAFVGGMMEGMEYTRALLNRIPFLSRLMDLIEENAENVVVIKGAIKKLVESGLLCEFPELPSMMMDKNSIAQVLDMGKAMISMRCLKTHGIDLMKMIATGG